MSNYRVDIAFADPKHGIRQYDFTDGFKDWLGADICFDTMVELFKDIKPSPIHHIQLRYLGRLERSWRPE